MDRVTGHVEDVASVGETVELRVGATLQQLPLVRGVAANIAMREDYDVDAIADIKLVVDEACSMLVKRALPWSTLSCCFTIGGGAIAFWCSVPVLDASPLDQRSLGWGLLTALVDSVATKVVPDEDLAELSISVLMTRGTAPA